MFMMKLMKVFGFVYLVLGVGSGQAGGQLYSQLGTGQFSERFSLPSLRNITSNYGQLGGRFNDKDFSVRNMFDNITSEILSSPTVRIVSRVFELYLNKTIPTDILVDIVSSRDMQQVMSTWLARIDVPEKVINNVLAIVSSREMTSLIKILGDENTYLPTDKLCATLKLTKLLEFKEILNFARNTSSIFNAITLQQLNTMLRDIPGLETDSIDRITNLLNFGSSSFVQLVLSPVKPQSFLDVFCEIISADNITNTHIDITEKNIPSNSNDTDPNNQHPKAEAQVLQQVADLPNALPDEVANQIQAILTSQDLVDTLVNLSSTFGSNDFVDQIRAAIASANITAVQELFTQYLNGSQGNGTLAIDNIVTELVNQASDIIQPILPFARQYIENFLRSAFMENGVSGTCLDSKTVIAQALIDGETWPLQFFDAMGKPPSNLVGLPSKWLGSFDECTAIKGIGGHGNEHFNGKYCRSSIPFGEPELTVGLSLTVGTCVPSTCSASDTLGFLLTVQRLLLNGSTPVVPDIECVEDLEFKTDAIIVLCILVIFGVIVFSGTLYDVVTVQMKSKQTSKMDSSPESTGSLSSSISSSRASSSSSDLPASLYKPIKTKLEMSPGFVNNAYASADEMAKHPDAFADEKKEMPHDNEATENDVTVNIPTKYDETDVTKTDNPNKGPLEQAMLSFSAYTNGVKLLSTQQGSGSLGALNGIRFLSMAWVILGHTFSFSVGYDDNLMTYYTRKVNDWTFSVIPYAIVSVDTFFTISGILVAYLTLKQLKKVGGAKKLNWFMYYFHRFWRLTPPYMLIMMVGTVILPHVATGPMWEGEDFPMKACRKYWWSNLLYINNYYGTFTPETHLCMGWTWYLANDMQFYILSPLILLPLFYNFIAGIISCVIFLAASIITTAVLNHKYDYSAQWANFYQPEPVDDYYFQRIYYTSYCRIGPYIIGLFTGYLLYRLDCKCRIPKVVNILGWLVCLAICCLSVYGLYSYEDDRILTQLQSDVYNSLSRTGWGVAISWIVFACATGHGGWINELLSWKAFIPLGRLTYCAYLIHPLAMILFGSSRRNPTFFSDYEVVYLFLGNITLSYGAAFIVSLFFESPMMGLEKVFFNKQKSK